MFQSARLKLSAWYLLIIMIISISFSIVVYRALTYELNRILRMEKMRQQGLWTPKRSFLIPFTTEDLSTKQFVMAPNTEVLEEAKERLVQILFAINFAILGLSGAAGYFLAGRTLRPIKKMVDDQNRFITDASHELRTPLTSLKSEIEVSLRDKKLSVIEARALLKSNLEEVNNLQYLSDNLIKLAQYQKSNGASYFENVSISDIMQEVDNKIRKIAKAKDIVIQQHVKEYFLFADKQSLVELFVIILDNAIKYSSEKKVISITGKRIDHSILIQIQDQGMGIDQNDLPFLFDRFYRSDKSRTKVGVTGYGLGLSIAKQIVEKHRGTIEVQSEVGVGTTFSIKLPIRRKNSNSD